MNLQKEDITNIDRLLEMYVQDEISDFRYVEISDILSIELSYAQFLIAEISELNDKKSFFRIDNTVRSGNLYPLNNDKFLIRRFIENGGYHKYLEEKDSTTDMENLSQRIDLIISGQIMLLKGQAELDENGEKRFIELRELLIPILLKKTPLSEATKGQVISAFIALGINPENLESFIKSVEKSIVF